MKKELPVMGNQPVVYESGIMKKIYCQITFKHPEEHGSNESPECDLHHYRKFIDCPSVYLFHFQPASKE
jgi:hypothetical protein